MFVRPLRGKQEKENKLKTIFVFFVILLLCLNASALSGEFFANGKRGFIKFFAQRGYVEVEGKGKLWIRASVECKVELDGTYTSKIKDRGMDLYKNFEGKVLIKGMNFRVEFRGENISFHAVGKGKAAMNGIGTYKSSKDEGEWGKDYRWSHTRF